MTSPHCEKGLHIRCDVFEEMKEAERISPESLSPPSSPFPFTTAVRDSSPELMAIREMVLNTTIDCFKRHGAKAMDAPVFALKEVVRCVHGDDNQLIYDLEDECGKILCLRTDLTVPYARCLATSNINNMKRYHVAKVYRREASAMIRGRYREFYQCDFDITGSSDPMIPDVECIQVLVEILDRLSIGQYVIRVNHRKLTDGILTLCGVKREQFEHVYDCIDKLNQTFWEDVRSQLIDRKGLDPTVVARIGSFIHLKGNADLLEKLAQHELIANSNEIMDGLRDLTLLLKYCEFYQLADRVIVDLSLVQGLSDYTGVVFEAHLIDDEIAVAGGGRYDGPVEQPHSKRTPSVGMSISVERIFALVEKKLKQSLSAVNIKTADVYVTCDCNQHDGDDAKLKGLVWDSNIPAEMSFFNGDLNSSDSSDSSNSSENEKATEFSQIPILLMVSTRSSSNEMVIRLRSSHSHQEHLVIDKLIDAIQRSL